MVADAIKRDLEERGGNSPVLQLCLRLVEYVANLPPSQREMLTYRTFVKASGKNQIDQELMAAITILSTSNVRAFEFRGLFVDDNEDEYEVSADDIASARASGEFIHPQTGKAVPDFENRIIPFFSPSKRFGA
ncbi:hypothetical protein ACCD06_00640 [Azospirillum sp. CT11-132]|uniref:hypothetical protein n=1 Tax=Azospirillum sp. CT11-132 TaxID=3396317 RepID=UPI0039A4F60A